MIDLLNEMNDTTIPILLTQQRCSPLFHDCGGQASPVKGKLSKGFAEPIDSARAADALLSAYFNEKSKYYKNEAILNAAEIGLSFLCRG